MIIAHQERKYRFFRPILWENADVKPPYSDADPPYSVGATAIIVQLANRLFLLTASHCLSLPDRTIAELRVPFRLGSAAYFRIGKDVHFRAIDPDQGSEDQFDIRVLTLTGPSCPTHPLERGEYLELEGFEHLPWHLPRQLSGFPVSEQWRNYEKGEFGGDGITIGGVDAGPTGDAGCRFFRSEDLLGLPADGMSGGAVTSNIFGSLQLEGICLRGAVKGGVDFVRYVTIGSLEHKLREAYRRTNQSREDQRNTVT